MKQRWGASQLIIGLACCGLDLGAAADEAPTYVQSVLATGLASPSGIALQPGSGDVFVSESAAARIAILRDGRAQPVVTTFTVDTNLPPGLVTADRPRADWLAGRLAQPRALAFAGDGALYVLEGRTDGRVLQFQPDPDGRYTRARVVPVPLQDEPYVWSGLAVAADGRLFLSGATQARVAGAGSSCVLACQGSNDWWAVDHGALARFTAVAVSTEEDMLITGDAAVGGLTWWDAGRRRELQTWHRDLGSLDCVCVLTDGALAVGQSRPADVDGPASGRVLRVDPASGAVQVLADGLGAVAAMTGDERTGRVLVADQEGGRVLALTAANPGGPRMNLLKTARRSGEARLGLAPRHSPDFLRSFLHEVGVQLVDRDSEKTGAPHQMTLEELGQRIPLVAGRVKVGAMPGVADPVTELSFINLFPNQVTVSGQRPAPSLCLFAARRQSGRVERSQPLTGFHANRRAPSGDWTTLSRDAMLMIPLTTCSAVENENGMTVVMSFIGLDRFGDSFLTVNYGRSNAASYAVAGAQLTVAPASISERAADGAEVVHFAMAGVRPHRTEDASWLRIGARAHWSVVSPGHDIWISRWTRTHLPAMVDRLRAFNREVLASCSELPTPGEAIATHVAAPPRPEPADARPPVGRPEPNQQAERRGRGVSPPVAAIRFPKPDPAATEENCLTNLLITRLTEAWQGQEFK